MLQNIQPISPIKFIVRLTQSFLSLYLFFLSPGRTALNNIRLSLKIRNIKDDNNFNIKLIKYKKEKEKIN